MREERQERIEKREEFVRIKKIYIYIYFFKSSSSELLSITALRAFPVASPNFCTVWIMNNDI